MASWLSSIGSAVINASASALSGSSGIPGVTGYTLGDKVPSFEGKTIWSQWDGIKKDDSTAVSVFSFDLNAPTSSYSSGGDRRPLLALARNALRKLRTLRHPNVLKFLDGSESDSAVWIITEPVRSLATELNTIGLSDESKVYGLLHLATALSFLNKDGQSIHGNVRSEAMFLTQGGEWKLGGMEVCTRKDEDAGVLWNMAGLLPDARTYASPEVRKGGWTALKEYDASALDSYHLHLLLYTLFNGPLPAAFSSSSDAPPALPTTRGNIPNALFQVWRRLGNPNARSRLKTDVFLELGMGSESAGGGWWPQNRLVKLSSALEGFSLATESERLGLIRTLQAVGDGKKGPAGDALPDEFLKYKVLPSLVRTFEFGGGGPALLPLILSLAASLPEKEYTASIIQPLVRMFATPDRAMRMALLEGLDKFADKLTSKDIVEKVWPHLMTGFADIVPVIREATVKSILLIAPKLNDRILNNDLLRHLAKTQTDPEPGIRTNTCILLGRLSRHLQPSTNRKVLVPAFARALRDPFVHARIAGLMALMATADVYEKEDLAGKVIPAMSICLVDREKAVRDQGYKAIDMFVKKCEALTANMPVTAIVESEQPNAATQAVAENQPGLATSASGAAGALAGWAFASVSKKLSTAELSAPIERRPSTPGPSAPVSPLPPNGSVPAHVAGGHGHTPSIASTGMSPSIPGGFDVEEGETEDWGGDLMDVNDDEGDWNGFESGQAPPPRVDPFAARLSATKPKTPAARRGGPLKLGAPTRSSALRVPMDMDAGDSWDIDDLEEKPKPVIKPLIRATPSARAPIVKAAPKPSLSKPAPVKPTPPPPPPAREVSPPPPPSPPPAAPVNPQPEPEPQPQRQPELEAEPQQEAELTSSPSFIEPTQAAQPDPEPFVANTEEPAPAVFAAASTPLAEPIVASTPSPAPDSAPLLSAVDSAPLPIAAQAAISTPILSALTSPPLSSASAGGSEPSSRAGTPDIVSAGGGVKVELSKEEKAAKLAAAREERKRRMAAARAK